MRDHLIFIVYGEIFLKREKINKEKKRERERKGTILFNILPPKLFQLRTLFEGLHNLRMTPLTVKNSGSKLLLRISWVSSLFVTKLIRFWVNQSGSWFNWNFGQARPGRAYT